MKKLNNRSTSSPSLRGVSITTKQSTARSAVIPECLCRESVVRCSAFTLVELVIVIAIVIILSVVSVPIYRGYTRNAKLSEGYALLGVILSSQKAYLSQYGNFLHSGKSSASTAWWTDNDEVLGIDARGNKYVTSFTVGYYSADVPFTAGFHCYVRPLEELSDTDLGLWYNVTSGSTFRNAKEILPEP